MRLVATDDLTASRPATLDSSVGAQAEPLHGRIKATAVCADCGAEHPCRAPIYVCGCAAQGTLTIRRQLDVSVRDALTAQTGPTGEQSLWRYASLLPADRFFASPLMVGWTPLLDAGPFDGVRVLLKDETRNPSGSMKDRASEIALAVAAQHGLTASIAASTGNAAASLACIGAAMGFAITVIVPETIPDAKLAQIIAYGAQVYRVRGGYDDAYDLSLEISRRHGIYNRNTGFNPFTREGKKTCAFEIAEQLGWRSPDWVVVPAGDGNILSGLWQGFEELYSLGLISSRPRLIAAQAVTSNAIANWFRGNRDFVAEPHTIADSIAVSRPRDGAAAVRALAASGGYPVELSDEEIVLAVHKLARSFGCFVEPSAAAAFAALDSLLRDRMVQAGETVVCVLTGSGLKDLGPVLNTLDRTRVPLLDRGAWDAVIPLAHPREREQFWQIESSRRRIATRRVR
jgi:threonine synthase